MKISKKLFFICLLSIIFITGIFILKNKFKNKKFGNNMSSQEIVDYILNVNSYKTKINVQVKSNKNVNKYIIEQEYNNNLSIQEVIEPANIKGTKIIRSQNNLKIENTQLSLSNIFENYKGLEENSLDLISFIEEFKNNNNSSIEETQNEITMKIKNYKSKYHKSKELYINRENKLPTKLVIEDNNQNMTIFIQYNDVKLNFEE